jgi:hypothetical protein
MNSMSSAYSLWASGFGTWAPRACRLVSKVNSCKSQEVCIALSPFAERCAIALCRRQARGKAAPPSSASTERPCW